jgi:hypothetical protein
VVLNCTWNLDTNKTDLVIGKVNYKDSDQQGTSDNIAPIVFAGNDIYLPEGENSLNLTATAYDPDGFIESQIWTKIAGDSGDIVLSPNSLSTSIIDLTGDNYTYQIQVTDNGGATATDTVNIIRIKNYTVSLELVDSLVYDLPFSTNGNMSSSPHVPGLYSQKDIYKMVVTPELPPNTSLGIKGKIYVYARKGTASPFRSGGVNVISIANCVYYKNGTFIEGNEVKNGLVLFGGSQFEKKEVLFETKYRAGDEILINLYASRGPYNVKSDGGNFKAKANIKLQTFEINSNVGNVLGLPIEKELKLFDLARRYLGGKDYEFYEMPDL